MSSAAAQRFERDSKSRLLVAAVQQLSLARTLDEVMSIVRHAARELTGSDGATFVLRDGDSCYYAEEDAISPLWKGQRFPLGACISGWAMVNREPVAIEDIHADARIPHAAYRPTFVQSLVMVPIRTVDPIGAIGNYWAGRHRATEKEVMLLSALADSTSIAMENVGLYQTLERKVEERRRCSGPSGRRRSWRRCSCTTSRARRPASCSRRSYGYARGTWPTTSDVRGRWCRPGPARSTAWR